MRAVYCLPIKPPVPDSSAAQDLNLGGALVSWKLDDNACLVGVVLQFSRVPLTLSGGRITPDPVELQERAYRLARYLADRLLIQTGFDALDPERTLLGSPMVSPENPDEERQFGKHPITVRASLRLGVAVRGAFEPRSYSAGISHSAAHGYYADAMRVTSPFLRFELLYKVIEYFFPFEDKKLDHAVSAYAAPYDPSFTPAAIGHLRDLRNRVTHPHARKGHANPQSIRDNRELHSAVPVILKLARLLLDRPPHGAGHP